MRPWNLAGQAAGTVAAQPSNLSVVASSRALPRGRHRLSRETVAESQRERMLDAIVELVAEHGYAARPSGGSPPRRACRARRSTSSSSPRRTASGRPTTRWPGRSWRRSPTGGRHRGQARAAAHAASTPTSGTAPSTRRPRDVHRRGAHGRARGTRAALPGARALLRGDRPERAGHAGRVDGHGRRDRRDGARPDPPRQGGRPAEALERRAATSPRSCSAQRQPAAPRAATRPRRRCTRTTT